MNGCRARGSVRRLARGPDWGRTGGLLLVLWVAAIGSRAGADSTPAGHEAELLAHTRQLTFAGRRTGEAYFDPAGKRLVFQSEREPDNPFYQIYMLDLETGDLTRLTPGVGKATCAWFHPSGTKVLYASSHEDPQALEKQKAELEARKQGRQRRYSWDYDPMLEIYEHDLRTGKRRRLTHALGYDAECSWSPDGSKILFASNRYAYSQPLPEKLKQRFERDPSLLVDLYIMDADGSNVRRLTDALGYDGGPFFSADGKLICWRRFSEDGARAEIWVMNADGTQPRQITHLGAMSWAPFFHPSGKYIIFTTNLHGFDNFELYIVDVEGRRQPVRVTNTLGFDGLPAFSPDGRRLAWTSTRNGAKGGQIFLADWNHARALELLEQSPLRAQQSPAASDADAGRDTEVRTADQKDSRGRPSPKGAPQPQTSAEITPADAERIVRQLASDAMEGRLTGTRGAKLATEYVAKQFERLGLLPAGDNGTWFQAFTFTAGAKLGKDNRLVAHLEAGAEKTWKVDQDWRPLAFSQTGTIGPAPVVFAGYGIVAPAGDKFEAYDSFGDLDVKGKWVVVLRYMPEDIEPEFRQHLARHASLRYKAMILRDRGAAGMIVVSGPRSKVKHQLVKLSFDAAMSGTSIGGISVTDAVAQSLLDAAGKKLDALQKALDTGKVLPGFELPGVQIEATIDIEKIQRTGRNVLARLPADTDKPLPAIMIGAHVDHLGRGQGGGSLARDDEKGQIHYGADDNASGVAGLIEIAEYLVQLKKAGRLPAKRDILFAAWTGEEEGLLGSNHYVDQLARQLGPHTPLRQQIAAYLNMDMIGRLRENLILQGVGSSTIWKQLIERCNAPVGLPIKLENDAYLPTDSTAFYLKGVPTLTAFTGSHEDYHTPRDTADKIDYEGLARIARLMALATRALAIETQAPDYVAMKRPEKAEPRAGLRAYLGTIPDYAPSEIKGVKLSGVAKGGPADKAGLAAGDIIVELAGRKIENIYDYTYAIEALKIGQPVKIVVLRDNKRIELTITPASRE